MIVDDDMMVGFEQPSLASLRCDMLEKTGELDRENTFVPSRDLNKAESSQNGEATDMDGKEDEMTQTKVETVSKEKESEDESVDPPIRDSLSL